jgi:hypothetical protein
MSLFYFMDLNGGFFETLYQWTDPATSARALKEAYQLILYIIAGYLNI